MQIVGIDAIRYGVDDVDACRRFWTDFGLEPVEGAVAAAPREALFRTLEGAEISVRDKSDPNLPAPAAAVEGGNIREVVWGVASPEALKAVAAELRKDRLVREDGGGELRTMDDSGYGIAFRLTRRRERNDAAPAVNSPHRPTRINTRVDWTKSVRVRQLGHVAIYLPDYRAAERFYAGRLGFRVSDTFPGRGVFLRAAGSNCHHNIFALTRPGAHGVHHASFEVDEFQEVLLGGMRMNQRGWRTRTGPGRHLVGSNYFWYLEAPCGGAAEYYSDMDYVTDDWQPRDWEFRPEIVAPWNAGPAA